MLKKNTIFIMFIGVMLTSCEEEVPTTPAPALLLSSSSSSILVGGTATISLEITDLETSVFGVSMLISYDTTVVEVDTSNSFEQGAYFGTNAISLFEIVDDKVHFSITEVRDDVMVSGAGTICEFDVTGLSLGTSTFTIVPEVIYFIDDNGVELVITDLEVGDLTITVGE